MDFKLAIIYEFMKGLQKEFEAGMPVRYVKGVGPAFAEKLSRLGILTIEDLLRYYPRDWEDRRCLKRIREAQVGESLALYGMIKDFNFIETPRGFAIAKAVIADETGSIPCRWMRRKSFSYDILQGFRKSFKSDAPMIVYGKVDLDQNGRWLAGEDYQVLDGPKTPLIHLNRIVPLYSATEGLNPSFLREKIFKTLSAEIADPLPAEILETFHLMPLMEALEKIHFPNSLEEKDRARARLAFEELFMIQTVLAIARKRQKTERHFHYALKKNLLTPFKNACGFEFTRAQKRVINEIFSDLQSPHPMNRLLQGDVGSGKTVVAVAAMLLAVENGFQAVLMAPTEILAEQHFITLKHLLKDLPVTVGLLTGSTQGKPRAQFKEDLAGGKINIAVGTHALLDDEIHFANLALAVIDEQHRFGVKHRLKLTRRTPAPDTLVMTATPIPRTLALGLYGDLNVSTLDELPPGRQSIATAAQKEADAMKAVRGELEKGHQAYIVYPLIDENKSKTIAEENEEEGELLPALDLEELGISRLKAAMQEYEKLKSKTFKDKRLALLHGRMDRKDKEKVMLDFKDGKYDILISTTVIEVGIDVPNATAMVIQNAERFGLSTLHQLRGRVGRGKDPSLCILVGQPKAERAKKRFDIILKSQNGFKIAEEDLKIRGPGEIFGVSQHGIPPLKIADFNSDLPILKEAQKAAQAVIEKDPDLAETSHAKLREHLRKHFSKSWFLATIA